MASAEDAERVWAAAVTAADAAEAEYNRLSSLGGVTDGEVQNAAAAWVGAETRVTEAKEDMEAAQRAEEATRAQE